MLNHKIAMAWSAVTLLGLVAGGPVWAAGISDLKTWTQVQDPFHAGMTATIDNSGQAILEATGAIPAGTDIGYQSVDGSSVAGSVAGHYFAIDESFHVAIDFDVTAVGSVGLGGIGFGIGEDVAGINSAGVGLAILNGTPVGFSGAARIDDVTQAPLPFGAAATGSGRFFVRFDSASSDIIVGVNTTAGSAAPIETRTIAGVDVQDLWNDEDLLVSFFLRSDAFFPFSALSGGQIDAVFSNFEVLDGVPVAAVPLPAAVWLLLSALGTIVLRVRR